MYILAQTQKRLGSNPNTDRSEGFDAVPLTSVPLAEEREIPLPSPQSLYTYDFGAKKYPLGNERTIMASHEDRIQAPLQTYHKQSNQQGVRTRA